MEYIWLGSFVFSEMVNGHSNSFFLFAYIYIVRDIIVGLLKCNGHIRLVGQSPFK